MAGREERLTAAFVRLADTLVVDFDIVEFLQGLVEDCVGLLGASAAGLLLADRRGELHVMASSSEETRLLELFQVQADAGPCLECYRTGLPVHVPDLSDRPHRWPAFAHESGRQGFRSVHAVPLRLRAETIGALNLFHTATGALPDQDLLVGQALADVATIGILQQRAITRSEALSDQLQTALNTRVVIEQAKGVLAERQGLPMDQAFERLRGYARHHNLRLADVATSVVTGRLTMIEATGDSAQARGRNRPLPRPTQFG